MKIIKRFRENFRGSNSDDELKKMAEIELNELTTQHEANEKKLKLFYSQKMKQIKKMQLSK